MAEQQEPLVAAAARRRYWREVEGRTVVEAWRRSGKPLNEFATLYGIHARRVARWARRLPAAEPVRFHPVRVLEAQCMTAPVDDRLEVLLSDGCCIRLPRSFAPDDLRLVLDVLAERVQC